MLFERIFKIDDIDKIELNDYAFKRQKETLFLLAFLNDVEIRTVASIDEDSQIEDKIEAIMFCGRYRDKENDWYAFCLYAKNCSKMIARFVQKKLKEKINKGYVIHTINSDPDMKKFHDFIFKEFL